MTHRILSLAVTVAAVVTLTIGSAAQSGPGAAELEAARKVEVVDGDLRQAMVRYEAIVAKFRSTEPATAVRALQQIAGIHQKSGNLTQARAAHEQVLREWPGETRAVAESRAWLTANAPDVASTRVWSGAGVNLQGQVSLDGGFLTFEDWTTKYGANLGVRDLRTGATRVLTSGATAKAWAENPVPSPDGRLIAYRWGEDETSAIRIVGADGSGMRTLLVDGHAHFVAAWSPDKRYLAASAFNESDKSNRIFLISTADGSRTQLETTGWRAPRVGGFSPDGRWLVYGLRTEEGKANGGVFIRSVDGRSGTTLTEGPADFGRPIWSPDGRHVLFTSDRTGTQSLFAVRVEGGRAVGEPVRLPTNARSLSLLGFTREGTLYFGVSETDTDAYTAGFDPVSLTASTPVRISNTVVGGNRLPEVSPDGRRVAFLQRREQAGSDNIVVRSLETGAERTLASVTHIYGARTVQWHPDGRSILIQERTGAAPNPRVAVRRVDIDSGESRVILEAPYASVGVPVALSPDGGTLFLTSREDLPGSNSQTLVLKRRDIGTGTERELYRVASPGISLFGLSASPDGKWLAFSVNVSADERALMVVSVDGGAPRTVLRAHYAKSFSPQGAIAWTPDSRHVMAAAACGADDRQHLCAIAVDGGAFTPIGISMEAMHSRMIAADGRRIVFTGQSTRHEVWQARNLLSGLPR